MVEEALVISHHLKSVSRLTAMYRAAQRNSFLSCNTFHTLSCSAVRQLTLCDL